MSPVQTVGLATSFLVACTFGALASGGGMAAADVLAVWAVSGSMTLGLCTL